MSLPTWAVLTICCALALLFGSIFAVITHHIKEKMSEDDFGEENLNEKDEESATC